MNLTLKIRYESYITVIDFVLLDTCPSFSHGLANEAFSFFVYEWFRMFQLDHRLF